MFSFLLNPEKSRMDLRAGYKHFAAPRLFFQDGLIDVQPALRKHCTSRTIT